ncbi:hypothetical protein BDV28DRAFT_2536 [Aspergillus coremiiformis]|uniref:Uncharacterized protein n=1 Tax=Aspergillus coremiiformis TaxID=138285 RepID=A0A5N6ZEN2_9EURO|nr:hypothetical protein BDV28DRAFT_2536 [Aspergillus coremiiformis]
MAHIRHRVKYVPRPVNISVLKGAIALIMDSIKPEIETGSKCLDKARLSEYVCLFPDIGNGNPTDNSIEISEFDPCIIRALNNATHELQWSLSAAWAIVLSRFVIADVIRFGIDIEDRARNEPGKLERRVCSVKVDPDATASSLLNGQSWEVSAFFDEPDIFNTGVLVQEGSPDESKVKRPNSLARHCH